MTVGHNPEFSETVSTPEGYEVVAFDDVSDGDYIIVYRKGEVDATEGEVSNSNARSYGSVKTILYGNYQHDERVYAHPMSVTIDDTQIIFKKV